MLGGGRTDLSGLTAAEARALFLVAGPSSAVTPEAKAALRKLVRALPEAFRRDAEAAAAAVVLDPDRWGSIPAPVSPHMEDLQRALIDRVQVRLGYVDQLARAASASSIRSASSPRAVPGISSPTPQSVSAPSGSAASAPLS